MSTVSKVFRITCAVLVLAAAAAAHADHHTVKVATKKDVGSYLTDAKGMTLYVFKKDSQGKSACAGECVTRWPIFYREKVGATAGVKEADFATITREDGQKQTTYKGLPLYHFAGDKAANDTTGQGVKEVWSVAAP